MIEIIPAIDIMGGRCVRLTRGDFGCRKTYDGSPEDIAANFADCGVRRIHLVDLDGARASEPRNLDVLERISARTDCELEWGGGIGSGQALEDAFSAGADFLIAGSAAVSDSALFLSWLRKYGERIILGADVRNGRVAVKGWMEDGGIEICELLGKYLPDGLQNVICTDISTDGTLEGPAVELYRSIQEQFPGISLTASGGVGSLDDVLRLEAASVKKVIVGKAIYEGRITLEDLRKWSQNA